MLLQEAQGQQQRQLATWLLHEVVPRLEDLVAVSYPLRRPQSSDASQLAPTEEQPHADLLGKGMVSLVHIRIKLVHIRTNMCIWWDDACCSKRVCFCCLLCACWSAKQSDACSGRPIRACKTGNAPQQRCIDVSACMFMDSVAAQRAARHSSSPLPASPMSLHPAHLAVELMLPYSATGCIV